VIREGIAASAALLAALVLVSAASAGGSSMTIGAVEDAAKWGDAAAKMNLAHRAGFAAVRMTMQWSSGQFAPSAGELQNTRNAANAARAVGIEPIVAIYNTGSASTPADDASRAQFVQFATAVAAGLPSVRRFVVGNEPNLNRYWLPRFNADGSDAAALAFAVVVAGDVAPRPVRGSRPSRPAGPSAWTVSVSPVTSRSRSGRNSGARPRLLFPKRFRELGRQSP
jgi:hypothetical protein